MAQQKTVRPDSPEAARADIEQTRARMSATLDEIEGALVHTREQIRATLDVPAKIRQKPLHAVGIVFGTGLLLGFLTGGSGPGRKERKERQRLEERADQWEERARRLLAISRAQEEEIEGLEGAVTNAEARARRAVRRAELRATRPIEPRRPPRARKSRPAAPGDDEPLPRSRSGSFREAVSRGVRGSRTESSRQVAPAPPPRSRNRAFSLGAARSEEPSRVGVFKEAASDRAHRLAADARRLRERLGR